MAQCFQKCLPYCASPGDRFDAINMALFDADFGSPITAAFEGPITIESGIESAYRTGDVTSHSDLNKTRPTLEEHILTLRSSPERFLVGSLSAFETFVKDRFSSFRIR